MAVLIPCLVVLRAEFDSVFPRRDKRSDGWIADALHSPASHHSPDEQSAVLRHHDADDKNEVHALDVDEDLRDAETTMDECVAEIHHRHRTGADNRITEIIYEGKIATAARGWTWRDYSGPNPHDKHAHFTGSYVTARENDTRPFGVAALARREDPTVSKADVIAALKDPAGRAELIDITRAALAFTAPAGATRAESSTFNHALYLLLLRTNYIGNEALRDVLTSLRDITSALAGVRALVQEGEAADVGDLAAILDRLNAAETRLADAIARRPQE